jgi:hypothetical protein
MLTSETKKKGSSSTEKMERASARITSPRGRYVSEHTNDTKQVNSVVKTQTNVVRIKRGSVAKNCGNTNHDKNEREKKNGSPEKAGTNLIHVG